MSERRIDWGIIQDEYESGSSLRALAAKHGVGKSVIGDRKYREKWLEPDRTKNRTIYDTQEIIHPDKNASVRAAAGFRLRYEEQLTWEEVASRAGYASRGSAKNAVDREASRHVIRDIEEARDAENYRLSRLMTRCYKAGLDDKNPDWTWAIDRYIALSKRRSELLNLDIKPEAELANQNYTKKIILTQEVIDANE